MHISGKLAIIGAIMWIVFLIVAFTVPISMAFSDPLAAAQIFMVCAALAGLGFFIFVPSLIYYLWKGRKEG
jgi:hypothetical protein